MILPEELFPFCPVSLTDGQVSSWNADNKACWVPLTKEEVVDLFWSVKKLNADHISLAPNLYWRGRTATWSGTAWGSPFGPDIDVNFETDTADIILTSPVALAHDLPCILTTLPFMRRFNGSFTSAGVEAINHSIEWNFFDAATPNISGWTLGNQFCLYDPALDKYYVPVSFNWGMQIAPAKYPDIVGPPPPDPKYQTVAGFRIFGFSSTSDNTISTIGRSILTVTFGSGTATLACAGTGALESEERFFITLAPPPDERFTD